MSILNQKTVSSWQERIWYCHETIQWICSLTCIITEAAPWRFSMMSSHITVCALWIVALSRARCSLKWVNVWRLHCIGLVLPSSSLVPTHLHSLALSLFFPSHSCFSTAGCCSKAASWRLDVWLPRWLKMLLQDPRENQEVVTSLRGELLPFFLASCQLIRIM